MWGRFVAEERKMNSAFGKICPTYVFLDPFLVKSSVSLRILEMFEIFRKHFRKFSKKKLWWNPTLAEKKAQKCNKSANFGVDET